MFPSLTSPCLGVYLDLRIIKTIHVLNLSTIFIISISNIIYAMSQYKPNKFNHEQKELMDQLVAKLRDNNNFGYKIVAGE